MYILTKPHKVKQLAREIAAATRPKFTRVSASFMEAVEANARNFIAARIHRQPSVGKTLV